MRKQSLTLLLFHYLAQEPMVKQADHNSPLVKGQSGVEGGWRERGEEEFIFLQFY